MKITLVCIPVSNRRDKGPTNLAVDLAHALPNHTFRLFTSIRIPNTAHIYFTYVGNNPYVGHARFSHYLLIFFHLLFSKKQNIYHFVFRPHPLLIAGIRVLKLFRSERFILTTSSITHPQRLAYFPGDIVFYSDFMQQKFSHPHKKTSVIPPGVNTHLFTPQPTASLRKKYNITTTYIMVYPGDYTVHHGYPEISKALPTLLKNLDVTIIIANRIFNAVEEQEARAFQQTLQKYPPSKIRVYHNTPFIKELIQLSDCVLYPIHTLGKKVDVPLVLLEALAAGKPIITTPPSNLASVHKKAGIILTRPTPTHIAHALREVFKNLPRFRKNARTIAEKNYSITTFAKNYDHLYHNKNN